MTIEAMLLLLAARALVRWIPLRRWHRLLGSPLDSSAQLLGPGAIATGDERHIGSSVERAAWRLGSHFKCLPKAICAHWMLHRRGTRSILVLAALPGAVRASPDDLHAWTETAGGVITGASPEPYSSVAIFAL